MIFVAPVIDQVFPGDNLTADRAPQGDFGFVATLMVVLAVKYDPPALERFTANATVWSDMIGVAVGMIELAVVLDKRAGDWFATEVADIIGHHPDRQSQDQNQSETAQFDMKCS